MHLKLRNLKLIVSDYTKVFKNNSIFNLVRLCLIVKDAQGLTKE